MELRAVCLVVLISLTACSGEVASPPAADAPAAPAFFPATVSTPAELIAKGDRLSVVLGCRDCHAPDMTGQIYEDDADFAVIYGSNLTLTVADYDDDQLARAIRAGVRTDDSALWRMPSEMLQHLGDADMEAVLAYLNTLAPQGERRPSVVLGPDGAAAVAAGTFRSTPERVAEFAQITPGDYGPEFEFGRYIVTVSCTECHGPALAGTDLAPTLDVIANYSREEFAHLIQTGESNSGVPLGLMAQVPRNSFSHLTDAERDAVYDYLTARANRD
jgi:mono/diheme cytochrome c family protein